MSGRYARLKNEWLLRGWTDMPRAVVNWNTGDLRMLQKRSFYVAEACDSNTDFDSLAFLPLHQAQLDKLITEGIAESCKKGEDIDDRQKYRWSENPRIAGIIWSVTGLCNLKCRHCYMEASSGRYGELPFEDILRIIDQFEHANVMEVSLTGGEPFLRKDLLSIIDELAQRKIWISDIYSNGLLITEENLGEIKKIGFSPRFQISFDGYGGHDYFRGKEGIEQVVVDAISKVRAAQFPVVIATCIDRINIGQLNRTYDLLKDMNIQYWRITPPQKTGNWRGTTTAISLDEEVNAYIQLLNRWVKDDSPFAIQLGGFFRASGKGSPLRDEELKPRFSSQSYDCGSCREKPYLLPDGTLLPCPGYVDTPLQGQMPNILIENLSKVWSQSHLRTIMDMKKSDLLAKNKECRECEFFEKCGLGCRAFAMIETGNLMAKDPLCCKIWKTGYREHFRSLAGDR